MQNPFKGNTTLFSDGFDLARLDRDQDIANLEACFGGTTVLNTLYISPRGTGKTTLLETVFTPEKCQELAKKRKLVQICQFDGENMRTDADVIVRLIGAVKESLWNLDPTSLEFERLDAELQRLEAKRPEYAKDPNKGEELLTNMLEYLKRRKYSVTLILDEFHQLACAKHLADSTFGKMASLAQRKRISYIVASDYAGNVGTQSYYVSPFYRIFGGEPIQLKGINEPDGWRALSELIRKKISQCEDITFSDQELQTVYELTGGIPGMIQLALKDLFEIKQKKPGTLSSDRIAEYALSACTPLMEKWVQYFKDEEWETMHAVLTAVTVSAIIAVLPADQDRRTDLEYAGLITKETDKQAYYPICPLFGQYILSEYARRKALDERKKQNNMPVEPSGEKTLIIYKDCTLVTNTGDGTVSITENHLHQGVSVAEILTLLEASRSDSQELFASNLASTLRNRLQGYSFPQLSRGNFELDAEYDQAYDKAFADYSRKVVEDVQVDEEQELVVTPSQLQTLEERFAQARERYRTQLTDEMLAAQSERCRFYLKLSVIVEDALELPGIQMDDYSPQLVLYGKALEQSLRDHFYPLFHRDEEISSFDTHHRGDVTNTFGARTEGDTNIGDYAHMISEKKNYLAQLCRNHVPQSVGTRPNWWNRLKSDIHSARVIRNLSDHANQKSPTRDDLDEMCEYLLGTTAENSILNRNLLGTELFMKMFSPAVTAENSSPNQNQQGTQHSPQTVPKTITYEARQKLLQKTCTMKCHTVKTNGNIQGVLCDDGYQVKVSKKRVESFRKANDCDGLDLTGRELVVKIVDCDRDCTYFSADILNLVP